MGNKKLIVIFSILICGNLYATDPNLQQAPNLTPTLSPANPILNTPSNVASEVGNWVTVKANPMLEKCVVGLAFGVTPSGPDFDCIQNTAVAAYQTWDGQLYRPNSQTEKVDGYYTLKGERCAGADGNAASLKCPIAVKVSFTFTCPQNSPNTQVISGVTSCTVADNVAVNTAIYAAVQTPGVVFRPLITGPNSIAGATAPVPVSMHSINQIQYQNFNCASINTMYISLGNNADGTPNCGPDPNQATIDNMATMMCTQARQLVITSGGETDDGICKDVNRRLKMPKIVNGVHNVKQCQDAGHKVVNMSGQEVTFSYTSEQDGIKYKAYGSSAWVSLTKADVIASYDGQFFCKMNLGGCPSPWAKYNNWHTTNSNSCRAPDGANDYEPGCGSSANSSVAEQYRVNVSAHSWADSSDPAGVTYASIQTGCSEKKLNGDCKSECVMWNYVNQYYGTCYTGGVTQVGCF